MNKAPLISYIIPFHNAENSILHCLKSIETQDTSVPYELLLINNNSTDKGPALLKEAGYNFLNELNPGASSARNLGLRHAQGKFLIFLDADIELEKNWTSEVLKTLETSWADCVMSPIVPRIKRQSLVLQFMKKFRTAYIAEKTKSYFHYLTGVFQGLPVVNSAAFALKKELVLKNNLQFDPQLIRCEDLDFSYQLFFKGCHFKALSTTIAYVNDHRGPWAYLKRSFWTGYYTAYVKRKWTGNAPYPWKELLKSLTHSWSVSPVKIFIKFNKIFAFFGEFAFDRNLPLETSTKLNSALEESSKNIHFLPPLVRLIEFKDYFIFFNIENSKTKMYTGASAGIISSFFEKHFKDGQLNHSLNESVKNIIPELAQEGFITLDFKIVSESTQRIDKVIYQKNDLILEKKTEEKIILVHLNNADFVYEIDGICEQIWALIDGKTSLHKIFESVYSEVDEDLCTKEDFYQDASDFIKSLAAENIILPQQHRAP